MLLMDKWLDPVILLTGDGRRKPPNPYIELIIVMYSTSMYIMPYSLTGLKQISLSLILTKRNMFSFSHAGKNMDSMNMNLTIDSVALEHKAYVKFLGI